MNLEHFHSQSEYKMSMVGQIPRVIRVLMHWNTEIPQDTINHAYLGEAARLRPDLGST